MAVGVILCEMKTEAEEYDECRCLVGVTQRKEKKNATFLDLLFV